MSHMLETAWVEIEAAMPEGWTWSISKSGPTWYVEAHPEAPMDEWDDRGETSIDTDPAEALLLLAERLRSAHPYPDGLVR